MLKVSEIGNINELEKLQPDWDDLLKRSRNESIFQTWEWISSCWRNFSQDKQMAIVAVREHERLIGLAPMQITSVYGFPLKRLQFIGTHVSDYLSFILDADKWEMASRQLFSWLSENETRWDILDLQNVPGNNLLITTGLNPRWRERTVEQDISPCMVLPQSYDELMSGLGKKHRQDIRRSERQIMKELHAEPAIISMDELDEGIDSLFRLHTVRWQQQGFSGVVAEEDMQSFYRDVAHGFAKRGWLRMQGIRIDGRLESVNYCFAYKEKGYGYLAGWDPNLAKYGVGATLLAFSIRDSIEQGCREFDFLRGNESYKSRWTTDHRTLYRRLVWRNSFRSEISGLLAKIECQMGYRMKSAVSKWLKVKPA